MAWIVSFCFWSLDRNFDWIFGKRISLISLLISDFTCLFKLVLQQLSVLCICYFVFVFPIFKDRRTMRSWPFSSPIKAQQPLLWIVTMTNTVIYCAISVRLPQINNYVIFFFSRISLWNRKDYNYQEKGKATDETLLKRSCCVRCVMFFFKYNSYWWMDKRMNFCGEHEMKMRFIHL